MPSVARNTFQLAKSNIVIKLPLHFDQIRKEKILLRFPNAQACGYSLVSNAMASKISADILSGGTAHSGAGTDCTTAQIPSEFKRRYDEVFGREADGQARVLLTIEDAVHVSMGLEALILVGHQAAGRVLGYSGLEVASAATELLQKFETLIGAAIPKERIHRLPWPNGVDRLWREAISLQFEPHQEHAYFLVWEAHIGILADTLLAFKNWTSSSFERVGIDSVSSRVFVRFDRAKSIDATGRRVVALSVAEALELFEYINQALAPLEREARRPLAYHHTLRESMALVPPIALLESVVEATAYFRTHLLSNSEFHAIACATGNQIVAAVTALKRVREVGSIRIHRPPMVHAAVAGESPVLDRESHALDPAHVDPETKAKFEPTAPGIGSKPQ